MIIPLLVLLNVTCLQKSNKKHKQIAKGIVKDIPMAIQVAVCKWKEGSMESITRTAWCGYTCNRFKNALFVGDELSMYRVQVTKVSSIYFQILVSYFLCFMQAMNGCQYTVRWPMINVVLAYSHDLVSMIEKVC